jgi:hypothetical protein
MLAHSASAQLFDAAISGAEDRNVSRETFPPNTPANTAAFLHFNLKTAAMRR